MQNRATYSPEDNKIRIYPAERFDAETFQRVKEAGFIWAPKQELFVAPKWSPRREDLAIALAGELEPEEMTLAERAQAKADRLENLAEKKARNATAFQQAAQDISERFAGGQPILIGHHSERKARKDQERMQGAQRKAIESQESASYWLYRVKGVERHANSKNSPKVRAGRIKTLLAELRDLQRNLNEANRALSIWEKAKSDSLIVHIISNTGLAPYGLYSELTSGKVTAQEAREKCIATAQATIQSDRLARYIAHTLNRLSYEREMLGDVARFTGELTPTILQVFLREHGADKPKAKKVDDELFTVECDSPLPAHIALGASAEMSGDEWRDLMESCGYEVPAKKEALPPILNFKAPSGAVDVVSPWKRQVESLPQVELTAAEYSKIHSEQRGTRLAACGGFRVRIAPNPKATGAAWERGWAAILITDQKQHPTPNSVLEMGAEMAGAEQ